MDKVQELIEAPLSAKQLAARYRALCEDRLYANVPGKIEIDVWGRLLMTPPSFYHGAIQGRLSRILAGLGGEVITEVPVATAMGLFVADVAWASAEFFARHRIETAPQSAPEICIEVVSPSNSVKELQEKVAAYLAAGAHEAWIIYPQSKRCEFFNQQGLMQRSVYAVDLTHLFD